MSKKNEQLQYLCAIGFYKQGKKLAENLKDKKGNESLELISVSTVSYSFSAELLLKILVQLTLKRNIRNEHKLEKIYNKIPIEYQEKIEKKYIILRKLKNEKLRPIKFSFNTYPNNKKDLKDENNITELSIIDLLKIHSESFIKWRYLYEIKKDEYYYFEFNFKLMDDLINSIIQVIKEIIKEKA